MNAEPDIRAVMCFWKWFEVSASTLQSLVDDSNVSELTTLLAPRVKLVSDQIGWEIGPGIEQDFSFTISLNGDLRNLTIAEAVVVRAPSLVGWEFHAGKPPKKWDYRFSMHNNENKEVHIDAGRWVYFLTAFDNITFVDITLLAANLPRMDERARDQAGMIVVEAAIGEKLMLERVDKIAIVDSVPDDKASSLSSITLLSEHLASLFR